MDATSLNLSLSRSWFANGPGHTSFDRLRDYALSLRHCFLIESFT